MAELPDHLDVTVTRAGRPLSGAWVELVLPMERKQDYRLMLGPADGAGVLTVSRAELENQISVIQLSAFMDYSSLGVWRGELVIAPFAAAAIARARARQASWDGGLFAAYPADFTDQMTALARRLAEQPGALLELTAQARGGSAKIRGESAAA
jgi:hypothetical protein